MQGLKASTLRPPMSALGQKQTCAMQKGMSALPPIATTKANFRTRSCLLYPRKRTYRLPISQRRQRIKIEARLPEASSLSELDNHRFRISARRTLKRPLVVIILFGRADL
jgi:hypothetical protein